MILIYIGLTISVILFFLKQWIHHGVHIALRKTIRYTIVIGLIAVGLHLTMVK